MTASDPLAVVHFRGDDPRVPAAFHAYEFIEPGLILGSDPVVCIVPVAQLKRYMNISLARLSRKQRKGGRPNAILAATTPVGICPRRLNTSSVRPRVGRRGIFSTSGNPSPTTHSDRISEV